MDRLRDLHRKFYTACILDIYDIDIYGECGVPPVFIIRALYFRVGKKRNQLSAHAPRNEPVYVITHRLVGS